MRTTAATVDGMLSTPVSTGARRLAGTLSSSPGPCPRGRAAGEPGSEAVSRLETRRTLIDATFFTAAPNGVRNASIGWLRLAPRKYNGDLGQYRS